MATNSLHLTTMCLQCKPTVVACVCIHLACKWANWEIPRSSEGRDWFWYVDNNVTSELLEELTAEFLAILDKCPSRLKRKILSTSASKLDKDGTSTEKKRQDSVSGAEEYSIHDMNQYHDLRIDRADWKENKAEKSASEKKAAKLDLMLQHGHLAVPSSSVKTVSPVKPIVHKDSSSQLSVVVPVTVPAGLETLQRVSSDTSPAAKKPKLVVTKPHKEKRELNRRERDKSLPPKESSTVKLEKVDRSRITAVGHSSAVSAVSGPTTSNVPQSAVAAHSKITAPLLPSLPPPPPISSQSHPPPLPPLPHPPSLPSQPHPPLQSHPLPPLSQTHPPPAPPSQSHPTPPPSQTHPPALPPVPTLTGTTNSHHRPHDVERRRLQHPDRRDLDGRGALLRPESGHTTNGRHQSHLTSLPQQPIASSSLSKESDQIHTSFVAAPDVLHGNVAATILQPYSLPLDSSPLVDVKFSSGHGFPRASQSEHQPSGGSRQTSHHHHQSHHRPHRSAAQLAATAVPVKASLVQHHVIDAKEKEKLIKHHKTKTSPLNINSLPSNPLPPPPLVSPTLSPMPAESQHIPWRHDEQPVAQVPSLELSVSNGTSLSLPLLETRTLLVAEHCMEGPVRSVASLSTSSMVPLKPAVDFSPAQNDASGSGLELQVAKVELSGSDKHGHRERRKHRDKPKERSREKTRIKVEKDKGVRQQNALVASGGIKLTIPKERLGLASGDLESGDIVGVVPDEDCVPAIPGSQAVPTFTPPLPKVSSPKEVPNIGSGGLKLKISKDKLVSSTPAMKAISTPPESSGLSLPKEGVSVGSGGLKLKISKARISAASSFPLQLPMETRDTSLNDKETRKRARSPSDPNGPKVFGSRVGTVVPPKQKTPKLNPGRSSKKTTVASTLLQIPIQMTVTSPLPVEAQQASSRSSKYNHGKILDPVPNAAASGYGGGKGGNKNRSRVSVPHGSRRAAAVLEESTPFQKVTHAGPYPYNQFFPFPPSSVPNYYPVPSGTDFSRFYNQYHHQQPPLPPPLPREPPPEAPPPPPPE